MMSTATELPCFVILGQSLQLRVALANHILGEELLPRPSDVAWHTVVFRYGTRCRVMPVDTSVSVQTSSAGNAVRRPARSWKGSVPLSELETSVSGHGVGNFSAVEVRSNHALLHAGARLAVAGDAGTMLETYAYCVRDATPVIVYAVHRNGLLEEVSSFSYCSFT